VAINKNNKLGGINETICIHVLSGNSDIHLLRPKFFDQIDMAFTDFSG